MAIKNNWKATAEKLDAFAATTPSKINKSLAVDVRNRLVSIGRAFEAFVPSGCTRPTVRIESEEHIAWRNEVMPRALREFDAIAQLVDGEGPTPIGADLEAAKAAVHARLTKAKEKASDVHQAIVSGALNRWDLLLPSEPKFYVGAYYEARTLVIDGHSVNIRAGQTEELLERTLAEADAVLSLANLTDPPEAREVA